MARKPISKPIDTEISKTNEEVASTPNKTHRVVQTKTEKVEKTPRKKPVIEANHANEVKKPIGRKTVTQTKAKVVAKAKPGAEGKVGDCSNEDSEKEEKESVEGEIVEQVKTKVAAKAKPTGKRKRKVLSDENSGEEEDTSKEEAGRKLGIKQVKAKVVAKKKPAAKRKVKEESDDGDGAEEEDEKIPKKKKRKTKEEKEAEAMPLAARTISATLKKAMFIGAHVSGAGGVHNSIDNALHIGANSFALFLKSQRKWANPPLAPTARDQFKALSLQHKYEALAHVLPHGSYLVNLAQADAEKADQAYTCFIDDLQRCEDLGIRLYNFHPGNTGGDARAEAIARIARQLNRAHKATETVITVLENMAGGGNVIGSTFEDLRDIIALVDDKTRVGVCLDTCHSFAAGYDLRTPAAFEETMAKFDEIVGMSYLKALHLNDSKAPFSTHRDLHANIGTGFLGLRAFHNVMNYDGFQNLPMVLETPIDRKDEHGKTHEDKGVWAREIKMLEGLIGADTESEEFLDLEKRLMDEGKEERGKFQKQADRKTQKTLDAMLKKASPRKKKVKKGDVSENDGEDGCSH